MARVNPLYPSRDYPIPHFSPPCQSTSAKPKVVSIPVKFADSVKNVMRMAHSDAAIKIQKLFRGFLVRRNLKFVRKIEEELNEIELKFKRDEDMDRIVKADKERLQIGEMLMRLLFRLDSVRGVRDYRKRIIRRVISIQEVLDSIASGNQKPEIEETRVVLTEEANTCDNQATESNNTEIMGQDVKTGSENVSDNGDVIMTDFVDSSECKNHVAAVEKLKKEESSETEVTDLGWEFLDMDEDNDNKNEKRKIDNEDDGEVQNIDDVNGKLMDSDNDYKKQKMEGENEKLKEENKKMKNIMETMISENAKLKDLVAELCKSSAQQCTLMGEIVERVDNLEKTVKKMKKGSKIKTKEDLVDQILQNSQ